MMAWRRLWPRGLAGRLVVLLVAALAIAQLSLVLILRGEQKSIIDGVVHGQALTQTVTLARLLTVSPAEKGAELAATFGSRESCAAVSAAAPPARTMTSAEQSLARLLSERLHGIGAGPPHVAIGGIDATGLSCGGAATATPWRRAANDDGDDDAGHAHGGDRRGDATVAMSVPLSDGRWMTFLATVGVPGDWNRLSLFSFLLSSLAVAAVASIAVRMQTRSLRALAEASDRFGRGETVPLLPESGPAEIRAVTHAFNTMQERLSQFIRDRLRLLGSISHDLRTPLTTLRLKSEFIDDEATRDDLIATIDELTVICESTIAFTRAEALTEPTATIALDKLVEEVANEFRLAGAEISVAAQPIRCACRPVALKRAIRNLVENAIRYGERASVTVVCAIDAVVITIEDDGPGVPPDRIEDAFEPFVRLEPSRNMETGGLGLGLAIARSIVRAHGGMLTLENRLQGGLCAEIRLPQ